MGDYTGLRFEASLTKEAFEILSEAMEKITSSVSFWSYVSKKVPVSKDFMAYGRKNFIPFGAVCYMPADWGDSRCELGVEEDSYLWKVTCSAKDIGYHQESMMELFCREVLPGLLAQTCKAEVLYEYWPEPKIIEVEPK